MSNQVDLGDPGKATTFSFNLPMPDSSGGYVVVINESPYGLRFSIPVGTGTLVFKVPSDSWRQVTINGRVIGSVQWSIANSVNTAVAPLSDVAVECYGLNECPNVSMGVISRQTNVGNSVPVGTQTTQVINTGNSAPTVVLSGTPTGAVSPEAVINNDGSATLGGGKVSVSNAGILTLPAGAVPVASIGVGALPAGVTVPAGQVGSGYSAADIAAGTLASGVDLTSLYSDAGKLTSDGAGNLIANSLRTAALVAATAVAHLFIQTLQSGATALGIAFTTWTGSAAATPFSIGGQIGGAASYVDDSGNIHAPSVGGMGAAAFEVIANGHATVFNADGTVSVAPKGFSGSMMMAGSAGGGNPGVLNWFGTTDPGGAAAEGDMWLPV